MIKNILSVENLTLKDKFSSKELLKKITFDLQEK